jgi:hypothetical protein
MSALAPEIQVKEDYTNKLWRLNNLYWIQDKTGKTVKLTLNDAQNRYISRRHGRDIILKARQHGFTTFIDLDGLDDVIFNKNFRFGIICHSLEDAKVIFRTKIRFPYERLPAGLQNALIEESARADELLFGGDHQSSVRVATSYRSGTLQKLHISEFGKISAHYPEKADEVKTGAMEAVPKSGAITIESTAEGADGEFFRMCQKAQQLALEGREPNELQYKFHFEPWFVAPDYRLPPQNVIEVAEYRAYFDELEQVHGIQLDAAQKAWYAVTAERQGDKMLREYPSTPEEAFRASVEGAYYGNEMTRLRRLRRVTQVPYDPALPVNCFWDLGYDDSVSIWFHQRLGASNRLIDYLEANHEGLPYYALQLKRRNYVYGSHFMPHDIRVHELGDGRSRLDVARSLGIEPVVVVERPRNTDALLDEINWTRLFILTCWIDAEKCARGIKCLDNYRKEWDEKTASFRRTPFKNWATHGADALRTGAKGFHETDEYTQEDLEPPPVPDY